LASVSCSGLGSSGTATPNLSTGVLVLNAAATAAGSSIACTFTDTKLPTVTLTKVSNGAVGGFTFTGTNGWASQTITTVTSGVGVTGTTQTLTAAAESTTITETIPGGYALASATCSGLGSGGTATPNFATGVLVLDAAATAAGSNIACTFTNTKLPTVTLTKVSNGAVGGFTFTGTNGWASQTITTVTSGVGVAGATQTLTAAATSTTITETIPAGYVLASATCSGMGGGGTATPNLGTGALVLDSAATVAGSNIACTFTNTKLPTMTLTKISNGGVGGFTFTGTNGWASQTITTVTSGVGVSGATQTLTAVSTSTDITETIPAGYVLASATCGGMGGGGTATPNLSTGELVLDAAATAAGSNIACTFTNSKLPTITLTKISDGDVGSFTFNGDNGFGAAKTITTVTSGVGVAGAARTLAVASTITTITETIPAGYVLASATCTGMGSGGTATPNLTTGALVLDAAATAPGSGIACTFTNTKLPTITLTKISNGGVGGFIFTGTNGWASQTITTATSGVGVAGATQTLTAASTSTDITETVPAGYSITSATCLGIGAGTAILAGNVLTLNAAATAPGNVIACTLTNTVLPTVTLTKVSNGGVGGFTFTGTNGWASQTITTATPGVGVAGATQTLTAASTSTDITETSPAGYTLTSAACSGIGAGSATLAGNVLTLDAAVTAPGNSVNCTFTNTKLPTITLTKISNGGVGNFTFTGTNGWASQTITTVTSGVGVAGAPQTLTAASTSTDITEMVPAGYALASATCSGIGAGTATLAGNVLTLNAAATAPGNGIACTFTNAKLPTITLTKISNSGVGGFTFTGSNGWASQTITTATSGVGVTGASQTLTAASIATTIAETIPAGYALASATCSGMGGGGTATANLATGALVLNAAATAAGSNIACTFTNTKLPTITLTKISNSGVGGFTFTGTNGWASQTITTVTSGVGVSGAPQTLTAAATSTTITESIPAGYALASATCSGLGAGGTATPNLTTGALVLDATATAAGSNIACTFTNTKLPTVTLTKISNGAVGGFTFTGTNGWASQTITTVTSGVGVAGATQILTAASTSTDITEIIPAAYVLDSATCSGLGAGTATLAGNVLTLDAAATAPGNAVACIFTNTKLTTVTLTKISYGGVGPFTFNGDNGFGTEIITTVTPGTGAAGVTTQLAAASTVTTLTETIPVDYTLTAAGCTGIGSGTATVDLAAGTIILDAAATATVNNIACTFTNSTVPLSLSKTADVANVSVAGSPIVYTIVVTNTGTTLPITDITVTDTLGTPVCTTSGNATIASLASGASEACTFTYTATQADFDGNGGGDGDIDNSVEAIGTFGGQPATAIGAASVELILNPQLTIIKTADTAGPVAVNDVITYTYIVTNTGNLTINGMDIADVHNGYGTLPVPSGETLTSDVAPLGDSIDTASDGNWDTLAPGDEVTFSSTYTVTQSDVDLLQ
jgi:uncharacterized repeat protein (TIGR01451 family)